MTEISIGVDSDTVPAVMALPPIAIVTKYPPGPRDASTEVDLQHHRMSSITIGAAGSGRASRIYRSPGDSD
jgi:hypothetical protein